MDTRLRDIYGLPCSPEYEELLQTYTPIWQELDDCQAWSWSKFLHTSAQQLGVPLGAATAPANGQEGCLDLEDASSHTVVVSVLQQLLARGERHAPELWADLVKHVHNGVPGCLRAVVWPVLLQPTKTEQQQQQLGGCAAGVQYPALLELQQRLSAAVSCGVAAGGSKQAQQRDTSTLPPASAPPPPAAAAAPPPPAAAAAGALPSLQDLQAIVAGSGVALSGEQLLEWRVGCRTWASQIEKDVHRTFPGHEWLSSPAGQGCLTRLLSCFCLAAPHLGYCQGMNYVAGSMLLLLGAGTTCQQQQQQQRQPGSSMPGRRCSQQHRSSSSGNSSGSSAASQPQTPPTAGSDGSTAAAAAASRRVTGSSSMLAPGSSGGGSAAAAGGGGLAQLEAVVFECLLGFAERVLPGYYSPAMVAPQVDQRVLSHLAGEHLPTLSARLTGMGLCPSQPCPAWLLAGFAASGMPLATVARLWDVAFFERSGAAFIRACLTLLHLFSAAFDAALDCCDAGLLLQALPGLAFDSDRLLTLAREGYGEVDPPSLLALQHCFRAEVLAEIEQAAAAARKQQQQQQQQASALAPALSAAATAAAVSPAAAVAGGGSGGGSSSSSDQATTAAAAAAAGDAGSEGPTNAVQGSVSKASAVNTQPEWVPDFDEAAAAATAAAMQQQQQQALASLGGGSGLMQGAGGDPAEVAAAAEEEGEEEEEEETGSLLGPEQQQQQQQQRLLGGGGSSRSSRAASRATSLTGRGPAAAGSSGGSSSVGLKTHSLEVSGSKAIAQAITIAASPGLLVLPCLSVNTPKQQQQQQQLLQQQHSYGSGSPRVGQQLARTQQQQQQQQQQEGWGCGSPAAAAAAAGDAPGDFFEGVESSGWMLLEAASPTAAAAAAAAEGGGGGVAGGLCGSGSAGRGPCRSPPAAAAAAAAAAAGLGGQLSEVLASPDSLRAGYGLVNLAVRLQELEAAAGEEQQQQQQQQQQQHPAEASDNSNSSSSQSTGGGQSPTAAVTAAVTAEDSAAGDGAAPLPLLSGRVLGLARDAVAAAEVLGRDLAQQSAAVAALQGQLDRSRARLEQQDAELATKDELIERLQAQLHFYESLSTGGCSSASSSPKRAWPQQQQQQRPRHSGDYGRSSGSLDGSGGSSSGPAGGGPRQQRGFSFRRQQQQQLGVEGGEAGQQQGFVAAALARFGSPTKGRGPGRGQQQ